MPKLVGRPELLLIMARTGNVLFPALDAYGLGMVRGVGAKDAASQYLAALPKRETWALKPPWASRGPKAYTSLVKAILGKTDDLYMMENCQQRAFRITSSEHRDYPLQKFVYLVYQGESVKNRPKLNL